MRYLNKFALLTGVTTVLAGVTSGLVGCGASPAREPSIDSPAPRPSPAAASNVATPTGEKPLPAPCEIAEGKLRLAERLSEQGFELRAQRLSERAAAICPTKQTEARELAKRSQSTLDAALRGMPSSVDTLWTASRKAHASGDTARARRLASLAAREQAKSAKLTLWRGVGSAIAHAITPDGKRILARGADGWVLLATDTLEPVGFLEAPVSTAPGYRYTGFGYTGHGDALFSPRADRVAILEADAIVLYDVSTGARQKKLEWAGDDIRTFAFGADGKSLFSGARHSWSGVVRRFDLATGDSQGEYALEKDRGISALAVHGSQLAVGTESGTLELIDANKLTKLRALRTQPGSSIAALAFSPNGDRVAALTATASLEVWETRTGKSLATATLDRPWHVGYLGFSSDGSRLRTRGGTWGETAVEIDALSGRTLSAKNRPRGNATLSPDASTLVISGEAGLHVVDAATAEVRVSAPVTRTRLEALALANSHLAIARETRIGSDTTQLISIEGTRLAEPRIIQVEGYKATIALSPNGQRLAGNFGGNRLSAWDIASATPIALPEAPDWVDSLTFAQNLDVVRGSGGSLELRVFSARAGDPKPTVELHMSRDNRARMLALAAKSAVLSTERGPLTLFEFGSDRPTALDALPNLRDLALSADGRVLVTVSPRGVERFTLPGTRDRKTIATACTSGPVSVSADGSRVLARCSHRELSLISASGVATAAIEGSNSAISPDGSVVVTENDGRITIFGADLVPRVALELGATPRTLIARAPSGEVEIFADELSLSDRFYCRSGNRAFPFAFCEDVLHRDHLLRDALSSLDGHR